MMIKREFQRRAVPFLFRAVVQLVGCGELHENQTGSLRCFRCRRVSGFSRLSTAPGSLAQAATPASDDIAADIKSVASVYALVEKNYADPITADKAIYQGAIPQMLHTLDPHSNFVDPNDYREMMRRQRGQYYGVGMEIRMDNNNRVIVDRPIPGSPAFNSGLRRGDVISLIDGKDVHGLDSAGVADLLRGPRGTQVRVAVKREGAPDFISVQITRGDIDTSVVDMFWVADGIAYLRIDSFEAQNVAKDVEAEELPAPRRRQG